LKRVVELLSSNLRIYAGTYVKAGTRIKEKVSRENGRRTEVEIGCFEVLEVGTCK
jgi:hypothetical protein